MSNETLEMENVYLRRPVIVLGMHKSGTTLISETLHASGIPMIEKGVKGNYDDGNKMEREKTRLLNIALLRCDGVESVRITKSLNPTNVTDAYRATARRIIEQEAKTGRWGFKDPRTLLTFDFWEDNLPSAKLIGVFRNPAEVFGHYSRRRWWRWLSRDPLYLQASTYAWCVYNVALLEIARKRSDLLLIEYESLMSGPNEMARLEKFLRIPILDKRKACLRRAKPRRNPLYVATELLVRFRYGLDAKRIHADLVEMHANQTKFG